MKKVLVFIGILLLFLGSELLLVAINMAILGYLFGMTGDVSSVVNVWISVFLGTGGAAYIAAMIGKKWDSSITDKSLLRAFLLLTFFWNGGSVITAPNMDEMVIRGISVALTLAAVWVSRRAGW